MAKRTKAAAIIAMKCPHCREGNMYSAPITEGIYKMHKECPVCKQPFELEPGFYWGAMYVGYGLSAGYMLSTVSIFILALGWSVNGAFAVSILGGVFIFPFVARLARAVWLHMYVGYDENYAQKLNKEEIKTVKAAIGEKG